MNRNLIIGGVAGLVLAAGIGVGVATLGGGGGTGGYGGAPGGTPAAGAATARSTVSTGSVALGRILVDRQGRTLYLFEADRNGKSSCVGACASVWPPLTTTASPQPGGGASAGQLGTLRRDDGTTQVTYHGHPLYLYAGDDKPGATNGQGLDQFGAKWYVLTPTGTKIDKD